LLKPRCSFAVMGCEKTSFDDNSFNLVTFSGIDINRAIKVTSLIIKTIVPLVCIEALGNNPIANIKRRFYMIRGKRTHVSTKNTMNIYKWSSLSMYLNNFDIKYFNLITLFFIPVFVLLPTKLIIKLLPYIWKLDQFILKFPVIQKYAFKTVVVFENKLASMP